MSDHRGPDGGYPPPGDPYEYGDPHSAERDAYGDGHSAYGNGNRTGRNGRGGPAEQGGGDWRGSHGSVPNGYGGAAGAPPRGPAPHGSTAGPDYSGAYDYSEPYDYTAPGSEPPQGATVRLRHPSPDSEPPQGATVQLRHPSPGSEPPQGATVRLRRPPSDSEPPPGATMRLRRSDLGMSGGGDDTGSDDASADSEDSEEGRTGGRAERRRAAKRVKRRRRLSATKEIPILIGVALLIAVVLKTFLVQAFVIPSGSMEQTIRIGDRVLVDKLTPWFGSKPERGDVVVFKDPGGWLSSGETQKQDDPPVGIKQGKELLTDIGLLPSSNEQDLIKRAVAVGGDRVRCCDRQGRVTVNGTPLDEPYLHPGNRPSDMKFDVRVPRGRIFVMGDHRANSADSRYHLQDKGDGTVPESDVLGRAVVIAWPFDHWSRLKEPKTYASVANPTGSAQAAAAGGDPADRMAPLPSPAELPLVMGVVGLSRLSGGLRHRVRWHRGGLGGRRPEWLRWRRGERRRRWPGDRA